MKQKVLYTALAAIFGLLPLAFVCYPDVWIHKHMLLWVFPVLVLSLIPRKRISDDGTVTPENRSVRFVGITLVLLLLLAFASSWIAEPWFYFNYWKPREFGRNSWGLIAYFGHAALFVVMMKRFPRYWKPALVLLILAPMILTYVTMLRSTNWGEAVYNDDHPSFLYRLWLIGETVPQLVNYVPQWGAGTVDVTPVLTGAWIPGLLFLPVWSITLPHTVYTPIVGIMYLLMVPLLFAWAIRLWGGSRTAAVCAAALSVIPTREFTLWLLHFGTIGANFSMALTVPISALLYRILFKKGGAGFTLALTVCILLMGLWPLGPFMALPMLFAVGLHAKSLTRKSLGWLSAAFVCTVIVFYAYYEVVLFGGEVLGEGGAGAGLVGVTGARFRQGLELLQSQILRGHPLLVCMGIAGALTLLRPPLRTWTLAILGCFIFLGGWADALMPDQQLYRLGIPMFFAAIPPAILAVDTLLKRETELPVFLLALLVAVFPATAWNSVFIYSRQGHETYFSMPDSIVQLGELIHREQTEPGRVLFTGGVGEEVGGGHIGYLAILYNKEMLANAYAHNQNPAWQAGTPPVAPPEEPEFFRSFVDTFGVSMIVVLQEEWREVLNRRPGQYELTGEIVDGAVRYSVYRVLSSTGYFIEGSGEVAATPNSLILNLSDTSDRVRIRYRWAEGLNVSSPARILPFETPGGVQFIEIQPGGLTNVEIRFKR
jgi:hypothetical protein